MKRAGIKPKTHTNRNRDRMCLRAEDDTSVCSGDWIGTKVGDHFGIGVVIVP